MLWIQFTEDHVKARFSARELEVYELTAAAEYPDDGGAAVVPPDAPKRMPEIINQVCNRFRGKIRSNPQVVALGPTGTLPDFCIFSAAIIARDSLIALPPTEEGMTNPRQKEHDAAEKELAGLTTLSANAFIFDEAVPANTSVRAGGKPLLDF
jgi:hypothetical protein